MKKLLLITIAIFALYSCGSKGPSYTIKGTVNVPEVNGKYAFLTKTVNREAITLDSVAIANGAFEFKGTVEYPLMYTIQIEGAPKVDFVVDNAEISVAIDPEAKKISGTPVNEAYQKYLDEYNTFNMQMNDLRNEYKAKKEDGSLTSEVEEDLNNKSEEIYEQITELRKTFVSANVNNPAGQAIFRQIASGLSVDELKTLLAGADSLSMQRSENLQLISGRIGALENTAVGQKYTDLSYPNPDGVKIALSEYVGKNKYVVVDFWASWCPPCRADMPNVIEVYKKYKNKGLEIVGVSLDKTHDAWVKGIAELGITWPQMSEVKFWDAEAVKLYGVGGIPHMVLIDQDGTIIARGFHGKELEEMLKEYLK